MLRRLKNNESGVAMVTVLLVGAVLTVAATTATFVAIQDLRASTDDKKAASALAYAEAGIDRIINMIRRGDIDWSDFRGSGCTGYPVLEASGEIGDAEGQYTATIRRYNPTGVGAARFAPSAAACPAIIPSPRHDQPQYFVIESTGEQPLAKRVVRQVIKVTALGLPIGVFANSLELNGTPNIQTVSVISDGDIVGRGKLAFTGNDPYYKLSDFWPGLSTTQAPAAAHTIGAIYPKKNNATQEHTPGNPLNCTANDAQFATPGQSQWDQSGAGGTITTTTPCPGQSMTPPPTSKMTTGDLDRVAPKPALSDQDYLTLKDAAKDTGLYCFIATNGTQSCTKNGGPWNTNLNVGDNDLNGLQFPMVAYFEFEDPTKAMTTNTVKWNANLGPCPNESAVLIVRNGSWEMQSNSVINGALLLPEGQLSDQGTFTFIGTVIAKRMASNGNGTFALNQCWLDNMPGPFLDVTPTAWSEVDR